MKVDSDVALERPGEALVEARAVLKLLAKPYVIRTNPAEASLLMCTTVLLESLAYELDQQGASERDLSDTLSCIRMLGVTPEWAPWIPYLEARLGQGGTSGV